MADENAAVDAGASDGQNPNPAADAPNNQGDKSALEKAAPAAEPGKDGTVEAGGKPEPKAEPEKGELQTLREMLAGGDDKFLKELERYKSKEAIGKAFRESKIAARQNREPLRLRDKATDDEIKAFREAVGIPDEAKDYPVDFREDYKASDADKEVLGEFKAAMHERNVDPAAASAALEWYQDFAQAQTQALDGNMAAVAKKTQAELRSEWGGEYDGNVGAIREFMTAQLGDEGFDRMMNMRLMDGSRLQDDPAFVKMMAGVATDYYGSNTIFNGDIETTSKTVQERIDELLKLRAGSKEEQEKFFSDATQAEITKLYQQRDKINARKG